jgi:hypothetical protein
MDISRYGVHETHCCKTHGCKYGDEDCPVVLGIVKQKYDCESCDWERSHWYKFSENPPKKNGYYLFFNPHSLPWVDYFRTTEDGIMKVGCEVSLPKYWTTYYMVPKE